MLGDVIASLREFVKVDVGLYPQAMEHVHHVLGGHMTSGALRVWAASRPDTDESTMLIPI
jgi:hypothetical protein